MQRVQKRAYQNHMVDLGYDPQPHVTHWNGTPIPPVDRPLALTPERAEICGRVWWWGGAEFALRNCRHFLYHVIDYGTLEDRKYTMRDVPLEVWQYALDTARQGEVSRGGHRLFSLWMGADRTVSDAWKDTANRFDIRRDYTHMEWLKRRQAKRLVMSRL